MAQGVEDDEWIVPPAPKLVEADDRFEGTDATVLDFWRFALSDLRMNNARGYLAEFLVTRALGLETARRIEWAEYDVAFGEITIEVKSSAYLQSWEQRRLSKIVFSGLRGAPYDPRKGYDAAGKQFNAMVYVFCLQTASLHPDYNVLDVRQWSFYVVPRRVLVERNMSSISLASVQKIATRLSFDEVKAAVLDAAQGPA